MRPSLLQRPAGFFDAIVTCNDVTHGKPHPGKTLLMVCGWVLPMGVGISNIKGRKFDERQGVGCCGIEAFHQMFARKAPRGICWVAWVPPSTGRQAAAPALLASRHVLHARVPARCLAPLRLLPMPVRTSPICHRDVPAGSRADWH